MAGTSKAHKVDLHVHSSHSDRPYSWFLRSTGAAECYTAVDQAYAIARRRGMDLVTLADHDVIDGALALCERHPGDTFVSVEVSARFPEDGCIVHVICVDVTEALGKSLAKLHQLGVITVDDERVTFARQSRQERMRDLLFFLPPGRRRELAADLARSPRR